MPWPNNFHWHLFFCIIHESAVIRFIWVGYTNVKQTCSPVVSQFELCPTWCPRTMRTNDLCYNIIFGVYFETKVSLVGLKQPILGDIFFSFPFFFTSIIPHILSSSSLLRGTPNHYNSQVAERSIRHIKTRTRNRLNSETCCCKGSPERSLWNP